MKVRVLLLVVVFSSLVPVQYAQQRATSASIKPTTTAPLHSSEPTMPIGAVMCDEAGNIYARLLSATVSKERMGTLQLPIEEITPEGTLVKTFRVSDVSSDVSGKHMFVSAQGSVYQVAIMAQGIYAVEFADDGTVKTEVKLEVAPAAIQPWDIAVFRGGGYLLTGETGKDSRTPYTAVFDATGRLVKHVYEPEDEEARRRAEGGDAAYAPSIRGNRYVSQGAVAAGLDGNVYVLRGTSPTLVYAISSKGEVVRKLHVNGVGGNFNARSIESFADRLAIGFEGPSSLVKVIDLEGNAIADYTVSGEGHMNLACYNSHGLTFISSKPGERSYIVRAQLP